VEKIAAAYHQPALVEKFISGYEFTVAVVGNGTPEVLPPVQVAMNDKLDLGDDFYVEGFVEGPGIVYECPAKISPQLDRDMRELTLRAYQALECRDFARIDIRVDYKLQPYFIECNPLPNVGMYDVFPLVARVTGRTYEQILGLIIESARKRLGI